MFIHFKIINFKISQKKEAGQIFEIKIYIFINTNVLLNYRFENVNITSVILN